MSVHAPLLLEHFSRLVPGSATWLLLDLLRPRALSFARGRARHITVGTVGYVQIMASDPNARDYKSGKCEGGDNSQFFHMRLMQY
jgi:hypothetical protein